jgi:drug/metabolite transporter (DMT)-like permease
MRAARARVAYPDERRAPLANSAAVWLALLAVYLVWGSTYLAIKLAIDTMPPLLMAAVRFLVAGGVLFLWSSRQGDRSGDRPGVRQWGTALVVGGALFLGGNGGVVWAERTVPTGLVALLVATVPLWMVVIDRMGSGHRISRPVLLGLVVGFAGLVLLVGTPGSVRLDPGGVLLGLAAAIFWAAGSVYSRHANLPARSLVSTAMQMLGGGALLAVAGLVAGEGRDIHVSTISGASLAALAYLIVFGSLVAFSAYGWLLRKAPMALVSTYAYVNPVVAVVLGAMLLREPLAARTVVAGGVILAAVALIGTDGNQRSAGVRPSSSR